MKLVSAALALALLPAAARGVTLEQAMADPDWIGPPVEQAYWSADSKAVYYRLKRAGSPLRDLHRVDVATGKDAVVAPADTAGADGPGVRARTEPVVAFVREGDVFLRDLRTGTLVQVTKTAAEEAAPSFMADPRLVKYRAGNAWFVYDRVLRVSALAADLQLAKDPLAEPDPDDLRDRQLRLFSLLRREHDERLALLKDARDRQRADATRPAPPVFLGDDVEIVATDLSPSGRKLLVVTAPKDKEPGRVGQMPMYVTESGYEEVEDVRTRVGRKPPLGQRLSLVDLATGTLTPVAFDGLPGASDDPLRALREAALAARPKKAGAKEEPKKAEDAPKPRAIQVAAIAWSP
jgi:hypothetical protein